MAQRYMKFPLKAEAAQKLQWSVGSEHQSAGDKLEFHRRFGCLNEV